MTMTAYKTMKDTHTNATQAIAHKAAVAKAEPAAQAKTMHMVRVEEKPEKKDDSHVLRHVAGNLRKAEFKPAYVDKKTGEIYPRFLLCLKDNGVEYYFVLRGEQAIDAAKEKAFEWNQWVEFYGEQGNASSYPVDGGRQQSRWMQNATVKFTHSDGHKYTYTI